MQARLMKINKIIQVIQEKKKMIIQVGTIITFPEVRDCLFGRPLCGTEKSHNLLKWLVVVDRGVMVEHLFTNYNLLFRQVVAFFVPFYMRQRLFRLFGLGLVLVNFNLYWQFQKRKKKININKLSKMFEF